MANSSFILDLCTSVAFVTELKVSTRRGRSFRNSGSEFVDFALFSRDFKGIRGQALLESATFRSGSVVLFDDSSRWSGSAPAPAMLEAALDSPATLEAAPDSLATREAALEDFFSAMTNI